MPLRLPLPATNSSDCYRACLPHAPALRMPFVRYATPHVTVHRSALPLHTGLRVLPFRCVVYSCVVRVLATDSCRLRSLRSCPSPFFTLRCYCLPLNCRSAFVYCTTVRHFSRLRLPFYHVTVTVAVLHCSPVIRYCVLMRCSPFVLFCYVPVECVHRVPATTVLFYDCRCTTLRYDSAVTVTRLGVCGYHWCRCSCRLLTYLPLPLFPVFATHCRACHSEFTCVSRLLLFCRYCTLGTTRYAFVPLICVALLRYYRRYLRYLGTRYTYRFCVAVVGSGSPACGYGYGWFWLIVLPAAPRPHAVTGSGSGSRWFTCLPALPHCRSHRHWVAFSGALRSTAAMPHTDSFTLNSAVTVRYRVYLRVRCRRCAVLHLPAVRYDLLFARVPTRALLPPALRSFTLRSPLPFCSSAFVVRLVAGLPHDTHAIRFVTGCYRLFAFYAVPTAWVRFYATVLG